MDVPMHARHVVGACVQYFDTETVGNHATGLVSVQTMHSRSPLRTSMGMRWLLTSVVSPVRWYRWPNLELCEIVEEKLRPYTTRARVVAAAAGCIPRCIGETRA